ncbi:heavy-metal-associated domain-containing protein [Geitlerinema sp. PCC 7407]|uniref:heavy-metal-associated domain-containing protein n=1 Tax=Geitlerinema sp. PCC 7407 TaxID=1173025 RepID=UPI00029FB498|nr:heavy-metal-associated domain-containing protein [Geitlerinema sp. PCC 7407]AFY65274.1 Heavy metal transport/detoxification protein [Geitlerinema sp. PCC 7407]
MTLELKVPSMACDACAKTIAAAVTQLDPNAAIAADPKTKLVQVETQQSPEAVKAAIAAAGYPVES